MNSKEYESVSPIFIVLFCFKPTSLKLFQSPEFICKIRYVLTGSTLRTFELLVSFEWRPHYGELLFVCNRCSSSFFCILFPADKNENRDNNQLSPDVWTTSLSFILTFVLFDAQLLQWNTVSSPGNDSALLLSRMCYSEFKNLLSAFVFCHDIYSTLIALLSNLLSSSISLNFGIVALEDF